MRHTKKTILPFVLVSGLLASSLAQSAQLGKLEVISGAGEPFLAEIQVDLVLPDERGSLQARLASEEAFKAARLTMDPKLKALQFAVQDGTQPGTALVKITSAQPLPAGFIDTLVELTWAGGRVAREYTLIVPVEVAKPDEPVTNLPEIRPPVTVPPVAAEADTQEKQVTPGVAEDKLTVVRGDTLSELALQLVGDGVSLNQAMAAIYEANKDSFINGSVHLIREGAQIQVPNRAALRAKNANEALLILAQNDDRNVYSAYARQIGLLTVENQVASAASTVAQGSIAPKDPAPKANDGVKADRLQIAPGAAQAAGSADSNAEELIAKNKALAEANERIALLEKNVSDLQRLLDMQKDLGDPAADTSPAEPSSEVASEQPTEPDTTEPVGVDVPSETLSNQVESEVTQAPAEAAPVVEAPVAEVPEESAAFNWMPWILAGAGGLAAIVVLLLILRVRKNKSTKESESFDVEDDSSFSEVSEFDEAIVAASAATAALAAEQTASLNRAENSDFDLDEVLNEQSKQTKPEEIKPVVAPVAEPEPEPVITPEIPELNEASEEAMQQKESLSSEVTLDFPEEPEQTSSNSILDDLDDIEKGTLAAQEELDEIRKQPTSPHKMSEQEIDAAFDDLLDSEEAPQPEGTDNAAADAVAESEEVAEKETDDLDLDVAGPKVDDVTWQEVATKLDLAGAYVEIGDADGAKELLNEIVQKGDADQIRKAKALLATLS